MFDPLVRVADRLGHRGYLVIFLGAWRSRVGANLYGETPMQLSSCCPETAAKVLMLVEYLPKLRIFLANVLGQMKLQPPIEHLHWIFGLDFDRFFTRQMPALRKRKGASIRE